MSDQPESNNTPLSTRRLLWQRTTNLFLPPTPPTTTSSSSGTRSRSRSFSSAIHKKFKDALQVPSSRTTNRSRSASLASRESPALSEETRAEMIGDTSEQRVNGDSSNAPLQVNVQRRPSMADVAVPQLLQHGTPMVKVSAKKQKTVIVRLDPDEGHILWDSKKSGIIRIENIKEIRSGADARYDREQFRLAQEYEDRWLTIVYIVDGRYKTLHLIATTRDVFQMWDVTLRKLYAIRQELMSGLGNMEMREALWEKQYWKGADQNGNQELNFENVEKMCKRLNVHSPRENLHKLFQEADIHKRGYLDFSDFQRFVKHLKKRPELNRLYDKLCADHGGPFTFAVFEKLMQMTQKSSLNREELQRLFTKYASLPTAGDAVPSALPSQPYSVAASPKQFTQSSVNIPTSTVSLLPPQSTTHIVSTPLSTSPSPMTESEQNLHNPTAVSTAKNIINDSFSVLSLDGFTSFLLSTENSAFTDQHGNVWHDMTRPLPEYYISSSHNTYLVGNQLRGVSTAEGYIRALLHSCRSVELDIYDGDFEPVVYHGKTLTTKVSVREICEAIAKYAFVVSPYPIIISAEVHCSLPQQDLLAKIMRDTFGAALVCAPLDAQETKTTDDLPSPEQLKGRILLKAKNLYVSATEEMQQRDITVGTDSSSTETSASDSEPLHELKHEWEKAQNSEPIRELKQEFKKARGAIGRVRGLKVPQLTSQHSSSSDSSGLHTIPHLVSGSTISLPAVPFSRPAEAVNLSQERPKVKMSMALVALLVYTVGVKCRGINKKEQYAKQHMFSLSENTVNKILKSGHGIMDLVKHNRTHLVRIYPKGTRLASTNYEPHRFWAAGAQLVAINYQTFDLGYMINHAMFQRNGRSGYVLKPHALRTLEKEPLAKRTKHFLDVTIISAQQLPRPKDALGNEILDSTATIDPYVEVSIHVPDWTHPAIVPSSMASTPSLYSGSLSSYARQVTVTTYRTSVVKNNGFNPVWEEALSLPFECVAEMKDLVFVRFTVKEGEKEEREPLAIYCVSLGSLQEGFRHLPLHDAQLSQYLFSTLFVRIAVRNVS